MVRNTLRICLLATCPYFFVRGKPLRIHSNILAFHSLGHHVTVITYYNGEQVDLPNVKLHRTSRLFRLRNPQKVGPGTAKICSDIAILTLATRVLQQEPHDLIVGTDIEGAIIAAILKKRFKLPTIVDVHGIFSELLRENTPRIAALLYKIPHRIEKWAWKKSDLLVCNWPRVTRYAKKISPNTPTCTIFDIPQPSVHEMAAKPFPASGEGRKWQRQLVNKRVVFYAGNFASYQNFSLALLGLKYIIDNGLSNVVLFVVGSGYDSYLKEATALGIKDNVLFIGQRTPEVTIDLMRLADICLTLIASGGNTPSKIIYYFLSGRPILACDSPAHDEFLIDGTNALLCRNHYIDFANKLLYLLKKEDLRQQLAKASAARSRSFTVRSHRDRWQNILAPFKQFSQNTYYENVLRNNR